MKLIIYYTATLTGNVLTWGQKNKHTIRETYDTEKHAFARKSALHHAWLTNTFCKEPAFGLVNREFLDEMTDKEWDGMKKALVEEE